MAKKVKGFVLSSMILTMLLFSAFGTITVHADDGPGAQAAGEDTAGTSGDEGQPPEDQTDVVNPVDDGETVETTPPADTATEEAAPPTEQTDVVNPTSDASQPTGEAAVEATPPSEQTDVATPTSDASQPTDTVAVEATPPADGSVPADLATEEAAPPTGEEAAVTPTEPILEQVPDNTTVTVLNTDGEAVPLASQAAADAIASDYDPIWCPAVQTTPTPGANNCTPSFGSFDELLLFLQAHETEAAYQQPGTIYVQQGQYQGGESSIDFNNYNFNNINNYDLTVQGGWDIVNNTVTGTTSFDVPITIGSGFNPWIGSLMLNNINLDGIANQTALTLYTQGDITLSNVAVSNSQSGADLNAGDDVTIADSTFDDNKGGGAKVKSGGDVTVNNTTFSSNASSNNGYGLNVESGGAVTLAQVSANNNELYGANLIANGAVTITASFFMGQGWQYEGYGLQVATPGNIRLDGVTVDDNYLFGANLTGATVDVLNSSFSGNSSNSDQEATGSGLQVVGTGNVTLASVTANDNQLFGADIQTTGAVSITDSFFSGNTSVIFSSTGDKGYGIKIVTGREVSLLNVEANENYLYGAHIEGADVAINTGSFSNNGSDNGMSQNLSGRGLEIISQFAVGLVQVDANNNQLFGADIVAGDEVAIERSHFNGHLTYDSSGPTETRSGGYGLSVVTTGNIALEDVTADNNYLYGAYLEGDDTEVEGSLNVDGTVNISSFSGNGSGILAQPPGDPFGYGLKIVSTGHVNLINVNDANSVGNQLFGLDITATDFVSIENAFFSGNQSVIVAPGGGLTFYGYGLKVVTPADIFLTQVVANFNNLWGCSLQGNNVIIADTQCSNNVSDSDVFIDDTGLLVNATGFVDLYNVDASGNRLIGADITAVGNVFIAQSTFNNNRGFTCSVSSCPPGSITEHGYGLKVTTLGPTSLIMVTNTTVNDNNLFGAQLNGGAGGITVADSTFKDNSLGDGLTINATDNVTLTNVTAVNNGGDGVDVTGVCGKVVQVTGGTFTDNTLYGLSVINATLFQDGTQVFANNGSGNVFTDLGTCAPVVTIPVVTNNTPIYINAKGTGKQVSIRNDVSAPTNSVNAGIAHRTVTITKPAITFITTSWQRIIDHGVVKKFGHVWKVTHHRSEFGFRGSGRCTPR